MNLNESMFATEADYWKVRSHLNESIVADVAKELGCERDNESIIEKIAELKEEAALGRAVRRLESAGLWSDVYGWFVLNEGLPGCGKRRSSHGNTPEAALRDAGLMEGDE